MSDMSEIDAVIPLTERAFVARIECAKETALVLFRSVWSGPSRATLLALENVAQELRERVPVFEIDMMDNWAVANRHNIRSAPTLVLFARGRELRRHEGPASRDEVLALLSVILPPESGLVAARRMVVGLDDDSARTGVLKSLATLLAISEHDTVALVHSLPVIAWMRSANGGRNWSQFVRGSHENVEALLETASRELSRTGAHVETHTLEGAPDQELVSFARKMGACLIVVGALRPEERDLPMLGSVSENILTIADANMLVVRPGFEADPLDVLVAIEDPADGLAAVETFVETIRAERVQVHLLYLLDAPVEIAPAPGEPLSKALEILKRRGISATMEFGSGNPEREVLRVASRRQTGLVVLTRGSVADGMLRHGQSSVLITRTGENAER